MKNQLLLSFLLLFLSNSTILSQKKTNQKVTKAEIDYSQVFDNYIKTSLPAWQTPGLSVAVVKNGAVVFKKAYGVQNLETQTPYTTATLSTCASTTKAMTAMAIAMLVDEGKLKWNDLVVNYLPEFSLNDAWVANQITIKDLLIHNTGLGNGDMLWVLGYSHDEIIKKMATIPLSYAPRSSFIYQNLMYMVAGQVIKKVSGTPWDVFLKERIFKPIGMNNSFTNYSQIPSIFEKSTPHFKDKYQSNSIKTIPYITDDNVDAAGGVWSNADDMGKWMQFLIDSTKTNTGRLLKAGTFSEMFKAQTLVTDSEFYTTQEITKPNWKTYGLGWFQHDYHGKMLQFHTGSLDGLVAIIGMIPDEKMAVYVFGNLDHSEIRHALMYKAIDLWSYQDNSKDWSTDFLKLYSKEAEARLKNEIKQSAKKVLNTNTSLIIDSYTGKYKNETYGDAEVSLIKNQLEITLPNKIGIKLDHWNYDTFKGTFSYWWFDKSLIQFRLNADGKVSEFNMDGLVYHKTN